jgi:sulfur relay (sulfurtransferase) DsrF/TusC family protein
MRVPRIANYTEAYAKWNNTKPMRGRSDDKRPLGERRDVDTYSIRKNVWTEAIELVLYQTPVIKFKSDDEVVLNYGRWPSASTCQFITRILSGVGANRVRGDVVLHFGGVVQKLGENEELVLVRVDGRWQPKQIKTLFDYRINRKEANNVRKDVKQFRDYLQGMVKLMEDESVLYGQSFKRISRSYAELGEVFGFKRALNEGKVMVDRNDWARLAEKPNPNYTHAEQRKNEWALYHMMSDKFYELVKNDQDENTRHQNYWIAFNILFAYQNHIYWVDESIMHEKKLYLASEYLEKYLEEILFARFSDRVFKMVELEKGKVPTGRYDKFVRSEA